MINPKLLRNKVSKAYKRKRNLTMQELRKNGMTTKQIIDSIKLGDLYVPRGSLSKRDTVVRRL